jgi:hypothetical protein
MWTLDQGQTQQGSHDKARAHKGGMNIGKKPKNMIEFNVLNAKELMQKL